MHLLLFESYRTENFIMTEHNLGDVRYSINHDKRIIYAERHDTLNKQGVYAEWSAVQQLDGFDPAYDTIVDYSFVPRVDLSAAELYELNKEMPSHDVRTSNIAIVTDLDEGRHMLARFFCTIVNLVSRRKHNVFHTKTEAELWIKSLR